MLARPSPTSLACSHSGTLVHPNTIQGAQPTHKPSSSRFYHILIIYHQLNWLNLAHISHISTVFLLSPHRFTPLEPSPPSPCQSKTPPSCHAHHLLAHPSLHDPRHRRRITVIYLMFFVRIRVHVYFSLFPVTSALFFFWLSAHIRPCISIYPWQRGASTRKQLSHNDSEHEAFIRPRMNGTTWWVG